MHTHLLLCILSLETAAPVASEERKHPVSSYCICGGHTHTLSICLRSLLRNQVPFLPNHICLTKPEFLFTTEAQRGRQLPGHSSGLQMVPHLVDLGQGCPHGSHWQPAPAAVFKGPPWGPLPPRAEHAAWGLLPLQRAARRLVPAQLGPPLSVAVGCAWLSRVAGAFGWCWAGGHTLGDVLVVRWWASLVGAAGNRRGRRS